MASVDLGDRCRPTAAGMASLMFIWPTDNTGTIRWLFGHNFLKVVLAGTMLSPTASDGPFAPQALAHVQDEPHS